MSTQSPKRIEGTVAEVKSLLKTDFKKMLLPFLSTWMTLYVVILGSYLYGFNILLNENKSFLILFDICSFFLVGLFHHLHFFAAESIENGDRSTISVIQHIIKNFKLIKPIDYHSNIVFTVVVVLVNTYLLISDKDSLYTEIIIYGIIVIFWKGMLLLPFAQLSTWIRTRITNNDKEMAVTLEKEAIVKNKDLLADIVIVKKFFIILICLLIPIIGIIIEPFFVLMAYVFYKHTFNDGLKMKQKVKVDNKSTLFKPKMAFSNN